MNNLQLQSTLHMIKTYYIESEETDSELLDIMLRCIKAYVMKAGTSPDGSEEK